MQRILFFIVLLACTTAWSRAPQLRCAVNFQGQTKLMEFLPEHAEPGQKGTRP
jgi:hypothetical protein